MNVGMFIIMSTILQSYSLAATKLENDVAVTTVWAELTLEHRQICVVVLS